nr:hypothetical protein [Navicula tsukamotoi]
MIKYFNLLDYKELHRLRENNQISPENEEKLSNYVIDVAGQVRYTRKIEYISLLKRYLEKKISPDEFRLKFLEMDKQDSEKTSILLADSQKLENLVIFDESKKFGYFTCDIFTLCIEFDLLLSDYDRMSESEFYFLVKNYFLQEQLVSRSFKSLIFALGLAVLLLLNIFGIKT